MDTPEQTQDIPVQSEVEAAPTPTAEQESFSKFNLNDVPDEHREYVESAYKQLQGDYTRKTQELAAQRRFFENFQNPDSRKDALSYLSDQAGGEQAILEALGYAVDEDEPDTPDFSLEEEQDPVQILMQRLEALEAERNQSLAQRQEAEQMARLESSVEEQFSGLTEAGHSLSDEDKAALVALAVSNFPPGPDGAPQIQAAFEFDQKRWEARQKAWAESKKAPHVSSVGKSAIPTPDLSDPAVRQAWMIQQLQDRMAQ